MELAIDLATPDATETDCTARARNGTNVMSGMDGNAVHVYITGPGGNASAWFDNADAVEEHGNSMLLCAAQMREQA